MRELLKALLTTAPPAVFTIDAMHTQHDTAQAILARQADVRDDRQGQHARPVPGS